MTAIIPFSAEEIIFSSYLKASPPQTVKYLSLFQKPPDARIHPSY